MTARLPEKFTDTCDVRSLPQLDDQSIEHLLNASESIMCQRDRVSALHPDTGAPLHLRGARLTKKIENTLQLVIGLGLHTSAWLPTRRARVLGWFSIQVLSRTLFTSDVAGVLNEVRQSGVASEICFQLLHRDTGFLLF